MPELKHNFLQGKMNKDLDERLVPNGGYRDALNVEVLTSEGSEAGTVQNLKGNTLSTVKDQNSLSFTLHENATTVGSYSVEASKTIFNFIHKASDLEADGLYGSFTRFTGTVSDVISEYTALSSAEEGVVYPLVTDVYETRVVPSVLQVTANGTIQGLPSEAITPLELTGEAVQYGPKGIRPGMRVRLLSPSGADLYAGDTVVVRSLINSSSSTSTSIGVLTTTPVSNSYFDENLLEQGYVFQFTSKKILNFQSGISEIESNTSGTPLSPTPNQTMITGINFENEVLFYTDGRTEPKRIVTKRFKNVNGSYDLVNSITRHSFWRNDFEHADYLREDYITTIRKNPTTPPLAIAQLTEREPAPIIIGGVNTGLTYANTVSSTILEEADGQAAQFALATDDNVKLQPGAQLYVVSSEFRIHWKVNDIISITGATTASNAKLKITEAYAGTSLYGSGTSAYNVFQTSIVDVDEGYIGTEVDEVWNAVLVEKEAIYRDRFISFAYRYKYIDGEYSCISPYSPTIFIAGHYAYSAKNGFNKGMESLAKSVGIYDFVTTNTPVDVASIEIILKDSSSGNAQVIKEVDRNSTAWNQTGLTHHNKGSVTLNSESYGTLIPSDQLLRNFDAVPRTAKAQEISSSRLLYGNYKDGFDIVDSNNQKIEPSLACNIDSIENNFTTLVLGINQSIASMSDAVSFPYPNSVGTNGVLDDGGSSTTFPRFFKGFYTAGQFPGMQFLYNNGILGYTNSSDYVWEGISGILPADNEFDPGNNWNQANHYYTITEPGGYNFTGSALCHFSWDEIQQSGYKKTVGAEMQIVLVKTDADGNALFINNSSSVNGENWDPHAALDIVGSGGIGTNSIVLNSGTGFNASVISNLQNTGGDGDNLTGGNPLVLDFNIDIAVTTGSAVQVGDRIGAFLVSTSNNSLYLTKDYNATIITEDEGYDAAPNITELYRGLKIVDFSINASAPSAELGIISKQAASSVKSLRTYEVGVVYLDGKGRETTVLLDESSELKNDIVNAKNKNRIAVRILNYAPAWAEYYKFFIREIGPEYNNVVLYKAYPNDASDTTAVEAVYSWLAFNSSDRNKISKNDYLILKKRHGNTDIDGNEVDDVSVSDNNARFRVLDIVDTATTDLDNLDTVEDEGGFSIKGIKIDATIEDISGKFFVKVEAGEEFVQYIGDDEASVLGENINNGACFEVEKKLNLELELFYEASQAYPIKLDIHKAKTFIKKNSKVSAVASSATDYAGITGGTTAWSSRVTNVKGALVFYEPNYYMGATNPSAYEDHYCYIDVDQAINLNGMPVSSAANLTLNFENKDGGYVTAECIGVVGNRMYLYPYTHSLTNITHPSSRIVLPWFNCFAFGNGVESDRIRDDFNASSVFPYTANGKQSGFKASLYSSDYAEIENKNDIIFSQIYNDATKIARYNEFIFADNITKKLNSEYGSIQKLYTRQGDVLAFCESKVLKILANKDALFNADGKAQLLSSTNVLGQATPFAGDYGISKNPESFAVEEYRIYFTDKDRGAVCRLSMDGITAISDHGMKDWFNDNLETATSAIGSYDGKKNEYNLTIHSSTNPNYKKNVYTVTFSEKGKGWTSFKSFIQESGLSMSNEYYTFKDGSMYLHHPDQTDVYRNNFYGTQYTSTLDVLFNDSPGSVKLFKTVNYEGSKSKEV